MLFGGQGIESYSILKNYPLENNIKVSHLFFFSRQVQRLYLAHTHYSGFEATKRAAPSVYANKIVKREREREKKRSVDKVGNYNVFELTHLCQRVGWWWWWCWLGFWRWRAAPAPVLLSRVLFDGGFDVKICLTGKSQ